MSHTTVVSVAFMLVAVLGRLSVATLGLVFNVEAQHTHPVTPGNNVAQ